VTDKQYVVSSFPTSIIVDETGTTQEGVGGINVDQNGGTTSSAPSFDWFQPLSRRVIAAAVSLAVTASVGPVLVPPPAMGWFAPLSRPVLPALKSSAQGLTVAPIAPVVSSEVVTVDKWFRPLAEPARTLAGLPSSLRPYFTVDPSGLTRPEVTTPDKWFRALSEPARPAPWLASAAQTSTVGPILPPAAAEVVTVDKWFRALSEPLRLAAAPRSPSASFGPTFVPPLPMDWHVALSLPVPRVVVRNLSDAWFGPATLISSSEVVTLDKWFRPLSEPLRIQATRTLGSPRALWVPTFVPPPSFGWFAALSQPVLPPPVPQKQSFFATLRTLVAEVVTVDKWFAPLSLPVRPLPRLSAAAVQSMIQLVPSSVAKALLSVPRLLGTAPTTNLSATKPPVNLSATKPAVTLAATEPTVTLSGTKPTTNLSGEVDQ